MKCINYAHRGFSGEYPENTMIAFEKAVEAGCEGIELDVHFTKDGKLVIIHDEDIKRTGNRSGLVKDMTYDELCSVDFSGKFTEKTGFCRIPLLKEYLEYIRDKNIITNIELKTGVYEYRGIEKEVYELLRRYHLRDKVIISSFNHNSVMRMKEIDSDIKCGFLSETWIINTGKYVKENHIEAYHPMFRMLTDEEVKNLRDYGIEINTWTVNTKEDILHMIDLEVEGIISNYPDLTGRILKEKGLRKV